jgi:hypothetical protein
MALLPAQRVFKWQSASIYQARYVLVWADQTVFPEKVLKFEPSVVSGFSGDLEAQGNGGFLRLDC